ncbi:MAG: hypothetical protein HDR03_15545 [Lachnospiraceae bacterium]|nr:hypothetical protein [Lachnospiraceae bacterium]
MEALIFEDIMSPGVILSNCIELSGTHKYYPDYLQVDQVIILTLSDKLVPSNLPKRSALVYNINLYITDENGNIAYFDCDMQHTYNTGQIRKEHKEYKAVGGKEALHSDMDAGHFGLALGQHPSIAMEQHKHTNRYGAWRKFEIDWNKLSGEGHKVNVKAVFVEGDEKGTYSPFWCIRETIDENEDGASEYVITNDDLQ